MLLELFKNIGQSKTNNRLIKIEKEIEKLKTKDNNENLSEEIKQLKQMVKEFVEKEAVVEERITVEKIEIRNVYIDKYETNNNIGALGIKELGGRLNIGANYGTGEHGKPFPKEKKHKKKEEKEIKVEVKDGSKPTEIKVNIRGSGLDKGWVN